MSNAKWVAMGMYALFEKNYRNNFEQIVVFLLTFS